MNKIEDTLNEIVARTRRIETRQMKVAIAQGFDPSTKTRVVLLDMLPPTLEVSGLDISLGDLLDACKGYDFTSGNSGSSLRIVHNGVYVGSFDPSGEA